MLLYFYFLSSFKSYLTVLLHCCSFLLKNRITAPETNNMLYVNKKNRITAFHMGYKILRLLFFCLPPSCLCAMLFIHFTFYILKKIINTFILSCSLKFLNERKTLFLPMFTISGVLYSLRLPGFHMLLLSFLWKNLL